MFGLAAAPSLAAPKEKDVVVDDDPLGGCQGVWNGNPGGSLVITTDPAAGTAVDPGDEITVNASGPPASSPTRSSTRSTPASPSAAPTRANP